MLKILHIIPSLRKGGAERLVLDICNHLAAMPGMEVKLVCFSNVDEYKDAVHPDNFEVIPAELHLSVYKKNKIIIEHLQQFVNDFAPDIIHTHLFEAEIISRSLQHPRAKWFSHCHDNMIQLENFSCNSFFNKKRLTDFYEKNYLMRQYKKNGGTHFIAISNDAKQYIERTVPKYPVTLLHNAIDYNKFYRERKRPVVDGLLKLVNVGSFVDKKNQKFLIDIAKVLNDKKIDFEMHLLGDGVNRGAVEAKSERFGLVKKVFFHGKVNNVEEFLWESDLYIHSATYEPLGLVLLEAMAAGLPVITLDGRGNRDLIEQGENGYMFNEQDPGKFADAIITLRKNKTKYEEMSNYAQHYAQRFDIKEYVERLLDLYLKSMPRGKQITI